MFVTHLGHACVLVETNSARLLIDPGVMSDVSSVAEVSAVLITHQHADHLDLDALRRVLSVSPGAQVLVDPDTANSVAGLPEVTVAEPGATFGFGQSRVEVLGGLHAAVYGDVPGCTNSAYLIDGGAFLHPGDSFHLPQLDVDILAVPVDAPWLKLSEAVEYLLAVSPRVAIPIHEGETKDPGKHTGMLDRFTGGNTVRRLEIGQSATL